MTRPYFTSRSRSGKRRNTNHSSHTSRSRIRRAAPLRISFAVLAALYVILAAAVASGTAHVLHDRSIAAGSGPVADYAPNNAAPAQAKYLVLMVLDGARPDYLDVSSLPHLEALQEQGTEFSNAFDGILEAETPAGHTTIATGSTPARDGILGFDWAQTDNDRFSLFNPDQMGTLEQIIEDSHVPTIAGLYKQKYRGASVVAVSGHKYYAAAPLGGPAADAIMYYQGDPQGRYVPVAVPGHIPPAGVLNDPSLISPTIHLKDGVEDDLATKLALKSVQTMHPRLLLINYPEFDWPVGHVDGGSLDPSAVAALMRGFDNNLGQIEDAYRKAGILDQTLFVITADHGMMPITRFVPASVITNAVSQAGTTAPDIAANSGDYVWLADQTKAEAVAQNIVHANDTGVQSVYYLSVASGHPQYVATPGVTLDAATEAANQHLLASLMNGHEPTVVVFGKEGASFSDPSSHWKADHGGNSWDSQHIPLLLAGPGIKQGATIDTPAQLEDVAPTALAAMGVQPTGMQGQILSDALQNPSGAAQGARAAEQQSLQPLVTGMNNQSIRDRSSQS